MTPLRHPFVGDCREVLGHGKKADRRYVGRWDMFVKHGFDPASDLRRNASGALEFCA